MKARGRARGISGRGIFYLLFDFRVVFVLWGHLCLSFIENMSNNDLGLRLIPRDFSKFVYSVVRYMGGNESLSQTHGKLIVNS